MRAVLRCQVAALVILPFAQQGGWRTMANARQVRWSLLGHFAKLRGCLAWSVLQDLGTQDIVELSRWAA